MTAWTTARTWSNETMTSTLLNTHLRDNLNHLYENKPFTLIPGLEASHNVAGSGGAGTSEEWNTATTGLTWTSSPTTVDSDTTVPSHLYILNQNDTTARIGTKSWTPAGAAAFDARMGSVTIGGNTSQGAALLGIGLHIGDSGNSNRLLVTARYTFNAGGDIQITASTYAGGAYTQRGNQMTTNNVPIYLRITRDGSNNNSFYWSTNGILWNFIATQALTLTVDNIGVYVVGNTVAVGQAAIDWLRTSV